MKVKRRAKNVKRGTFYREKARFVTEVLPKVSIFQKKARKTFAVSQYVRIFAPTNLNLHLLLTYY